MAESWDIRLVSNVFDPYSTEEEIHAVERDQKWYYRLFLYIEGLHLPYLRESFYYIESWPERELHISRTPENPNCRTEVWISDDFDLRAVVILKSGESVSLSSRTKVKHTLTNNATKIRRLKSAPPHFSDARIRGVSFEHERLVENIFHRLQHQKRVNTMLIQREALVRGRQGLHRIDIIWKFNSEDTIFTVAIECKARRRPVDSSAIAKFAYLLDDLDERPHGVMISTGGFHNEAMRTAREHDITAIKVNRSDFSTDSEGEISGISLSITVIGRDYEPITGEDVEFDIDEIRAEMRKRALKTVDIKLSLGEGQGPQAYDKDGRSLGPLVQILDKIPAAEGVKATHEFNPCIYIDSGDSNMPKIPLRSIKFKFKNRTIQTRQAIDFAPSIIDDILRGAKISLTRARP